jgi:putative capsular polysaccharide synthesis protein
LRNHPSGWIHFGSALSCVFESHEHHFLTLETFLGREVREVVDANRSERKPYSGVYAEVKAQMRFPPAFLQAQFDSKMMRHFYSAGERRSFQTRWSQR